MDFYQIHFDYDDLKKSNISNIWFDYKKIKCLK